MSVVDKFKAFVCRVAGPQPAAAPARTYLGALKDDDDEVALQLVQNAIRRDDPKAMAILGIMHATGRVADSNPQEAYAWLLQAAVRGVPDAMVATGICLASGEGVTRNLPEAAYWLHRAAKQGYLFGMGMLGWLCNRYPELIGIHFSEDELCSLLIAYAKQRDGLTPAQLARLDQLNQLQGHAS